MITRVVLGSLAITLLLGADEPAKDAKKELEALQGEWIQVSSEFRGKLNVPRNEIKITIKRDKWTAVLKNAKPLDKPPKEGDSAVQTKDGIEITSTIKIDPSKNPKTIDVTIIKDGKEQTSLCIYKLEDDTLTICKTNDGKERPSEFKITKEDGHIAVWKRAKK
jgi:uncharacterized protein (TIGR03067 family)